MPAFNTPVNVDQYSDMNVRKLIPPGTYLANVSGSEVKENNAKTGHYLELTVTILQGPEANSTIPVRLNMWHPTPKTVEIANQELATIARACGLSGNVMASEQLHGIPMEIDVIEEPSDNPKYGPQSRITMYRRANMAAQGTAPQQPAAPQAPAQVQAPAQPAAPAAVTAPQPPAAPAPVVAPPAQAAPPVAPPSQPQAPAPAAPAPGTAPW